MHLQRDTVVLAVYVPQCTPRPGGAPGASRSGMVAQGVRDAAHAHLQGIGM